MDAAMRNMQTQVGQLAATSNIRQPKDLPSDIETNLKDVEHCKAMTLRSARELEATTVSPNISYVGTCKKRLQLQKGKRRS